MDTPIALQLTLRPHASPVAGTLPIQVCGGAEARVSLDDGQCRVELALPERSRTELRYVVDQCVKAVKGLVKVNSAVLSGPGVDVDTMTTVGLDLHHRFKGAVSFPEAEAVAAKVARIGGYEDLYRDWINEDPSTRTSIAIASDISSWGAEQDKVDVRVLDDAEIREKGLNLLTAVGGSSPFSPPRLVLAEYQPGATRQAPFALVGKGVTFDSGGINVKPYASFVSMMKNDMGGAALAFALFKGLVEGGYPEALSLVIPTCENAVGETAMKPGAVVKSFSGKTVRIDHTDAEGRLILADGIAYAGQVQKPKGYLCFATLTTAALNAYGPFATPVHFADAAFQAKVEAAGEAMGEDFHFFPQRLWHEIANEDKEADLRNTARLPGNASAGAGSRNAAHFLREFANAPLCHLDIFASTWNWSGEAPGAGYGATGAPLRTLLQALS